MPMINFSIEQLEALQDALSLLNAVKLLFRHVEGWDIPGIESKINSCIGDTDFRHSSLQ
jgi:hypothetical protein